MVVEVSENVFFNPIPSHSQRVIPIPIANTKCNLVTALHGMQTRLAMRILSVRQTREL